MDGAAGALNTVFPSLTSHHRAMGPPGLLVGGILHLTFKGRQVQSILLHFGGGCLVDAPPVHLLELVKCPFAAHDGQAVTNEIIKL